MNSLVRRYGIGLTGIFLLLTAFWMLVLVWIPYAVMIEQSFRLYLPFMEIGGPNDVYTLANYASLFDASTTKPFLVFELPLTIYVFIVTVLYSCLVTVLCVCFAYPLAWFIAKRASSRVVPTLLVLIAIPLFVSEFLRTYALYIILAFQGPLNAILDLFGLPKVRWLSGYTGVVIGMVYCYFLFMFFPIYNSLTTLDTNQIEAAEDLGAKWWRVHYHIALPHAKTGISSGCTMTFMFAVGSILVPVLLGSPSSRWFTEIILRTMFESQDWNAASAYAFILLLACLLFISVIMRLFGVNLTQIAK